MTLSVNDKNSKLLWNNRKYAVRLQEAPDGELQLFIHKLDSQGEVPARGYTPNRNYFNTHYLKTGV